MAEFKIGSRLVGDGHPTFFIAEVGANHDGRLERAFKLIELAKDSGADAAKFQHYRADTLCSKEGFKGLNLAHYTENPYDVFKKYEVPWEWTPLLKEYCDKVGIEFMSTPYDLDAVDHLEPFVNAYKIGSGDSTYPTLIARVISTKKPVILSIGATSVEDLNRTIDELEKLVGIDDFDLCILECNTNYEGVEDSARFYNLNVFASGNESFVLGLSDHSPDDELVVAAVARGAKVIEKHFTDGQSTSPDNPFALYPLAYQRTVEKVRRVEAALVPRLKRVEENEKETVILQRRCLRAAHNLPEGTILREDMLVALRPAPVGSLPPYELGKALGRTLGRTVLRGDYIRERDLH